MRKLFLIVAACALFACSSDSNSSTTDAGAGADGKDAGGAETEDDAGSASSQLARPPGSLERPPKSGLPDDLRPPKE